MRVIGLVKLKLFRKLVFILFTWLIKMGRAIYILEAGERRNYPIAIKEKIKSPSLKFSDLINTIFKS
jgi:hypothetical protein